jgi:hypothetical protein
MNNKGIIFSTDTTISFILALFTLLIFTLFLSNIILAQEREIKQTELDEKALFMADSLVKNQNEENATLGACFYDSDKKRVLTNSIDYITLKTNSKQVETGNFFVKQIKIKFIKTNQIEVIKLSEQSSNECTTVKRFTLINNEKSTTEVTVCKKTV